MSQADFVSRGQALVAAGQFQEAVKVCRLGLLGRPTTVEGRVVLGQALLALKRYDEVLAEMRVALELDHTSIPAQILKGEALLRKGDNAGALETLHKARQAAPGDGLILKLLAQAEAASVKPALSASHPAVSFVGSGETKHYPNHADGDEDSGGGYTKPTSLSAPGSLRRSSQRQAAVAPDGTPSPEQLAVGDKSGTVEVDPELDGVEMPDDVDFDDLAAPPRAKKAAAIGGPRGSVKSSGARDGSTVQGSRKAQAEAIAKRPKAAKKESTPTIDLDDDDDLLEMGETRLPPEAAPVRASRAKLPGPGTAVRNAVAMPSGPLDSPPPRDKPLSAPPPVSAMPPAQPLPPAPVPRLAAALPTVAAIQPPMPLGGPAQPMQRMPLGMPMGGPQPPQPSPASVAAAARPTMAIQPPPSPMDQPAWAQQTMLPPGMQQPPAPMQMPPPPQQQRHVAAAFEPTARPGEMLDPAIAALIANQPSDASISGVSGAGVVAFEQPMMTSGKARTGVRRPRSKLQIAVWILIGVVVIGGGVFAGFQIRAMRLQKQIAAARDSANDLAKADTWTGWLLADKRLSEIADASATIENRAALARARALIAFEFDENLTEAKAAVEALGGQGGLDGEIATAYLALAQSDAKAAKLAADAAISSAGQDAGAQYVAGEAALLGGDLKSAVVYLKEAYKEPRPLYGVALARAYAAQDAWEDAAATLERVLGTNPDHPAALIERAKVFAASGRVAASPSAGTEVRSQLEKIIAEGSQPVGKQTRGVAPAQVAFADLALARVDYARGDTTSSHGALKAVVSIGIDEQRFAEEWIDTLYAVGSLNAARGAVDRALQEWPGSRRARIALAQILIANGRANEALDVLAKPPDVTGLPLGLAVRGLARDAAGDVEGARGDLDGALKKLPNLEPALVGLAWIDLAANDADSAKKLIEPHVGQAGMSPAVATVWAAILRRSNDAASRDKAKGILEKLTSGPQGPDVASAQLELARLYRDIGEFRSARSAYAEAIKGNSFDARLENAQLLIEERDPNGGRDALESLYKDAGEHPPANLVLELARARMLVGENELAKLALDGADDAAKSATGGKLPAIAKWKWKLDRERGRLALRRGDFAGAAQALGRALEGCGGDSETFLLAADTATSDDKQTTGLADKIKKLAPDRLKGQPELAIVNGKLALALAGKEAEALAEFVKAKDALDKGKASSRRLAQAHFGIAVAKYQLHDDAEAKLELEFVKELDPSLYTAYLYYASLDADKNRRAAFELAKKAVQYNPDAASGWLLVGQLGGKLGDRKAVAEAIAKLQKIAPGGDELKQLKK